MSLLSFSQKMHRMTVVILSPIRVPLRLLTKATRTSLAENTGTYLLNIIQLFSDILTLDNESLADIGNHWPIPLIFTVVITITQSSRLTPQKMHTKNDAIFSIYGRNRIIHRGLKLDGAIGQEEICNSLKSENFSKSFLSHIGKN